MHRFAVGHGKTVGEYCPVEVGYERLFNSSRKPLRLSVFAVFGMDERGHVNAVERTYLFVKLLRRAAAFEVNFCDVGVDALPVAYKEYVEEVRKRLGVNRARAARDDQRVVSAAALFARERYARKFEHIQNVGVAQFVLQRKAHHVEVFERRFEREGVEGHAQLLQPLPEVPCRGKAEVGAHAALFKRFRDDFYAEVAHSHLVKVGEAHAEVELAPFGFGRAVFPARIARRFFTF